MCETCGCGDPQVVPVEIHDRILSANDRQARHNREHFEAQGVLAVNLMGSPGSGKTAVLEATARGFAGRRRLGALAGDLETDYDARRLDAVGIRALAISTGSACHLDAEMIHHALHQFPWEGLDYLFVENVGNLVCPAVYDLGEAADVVVLSVSEGPDKPLKYPAMFRKASLVLLTKLDLLPHLGGVTVAAFEDALARVMPDPRVLPMSPAHDLGLEPWVEWLESRRAALMPPPVVAAGAVRED